MTVNDLLDRLGDDELYLWRIYFSMNPCPDSYDAYKHTANICSTLYATVGHTVHPEKFMPNYETASGKSADNLESMKKLLYSVALPKKDINTIHVHGDEKLKALDGGICPNQ
jgi:hypothetical protein